MVLYALKKMVDSDPDAKVRFEVTIALLQLGCWENVVMKSVATFLTDYTDNVKAHMLDGILTSKNAQFVEKVIKCQCTRTITRIFLYQKLQ